MGTPGGFKLRHFVLGAILLIVGIWIAAHAILVALAAGDLTGYVLGRRSGRRRAVLDAAREILAERARDLGRLPL